MFRVVYFLYRRSDLTHEEFVNHWWHTHVPLVRQFPGLIRYQIAPVTGSPDDVPPDVDGVAELYYESREAFERAQTSRQMEIALRDTPNFTRLVTAVFVEDRPVSLPEPLAAY